ncbi:choice-of-anchor A family protein [Paucibacter sp. XJ19-41]|uniref:choice-of-anchor A family protein n=1 Tax=Paucibacter sp. XJ19-41 TaxID=2927824 RepID=UPI00234A21E2|nr:collagen-binding domain-containing protein [Paucibacter sp. XJ19-41]MDC6166225.1 choice-of-anchor A family protein [Paucibacter sp. XJ19-41]
MTGLMVQAAQALPVIDFGVAQGYSGFFFGNVNAAADVEGRLAVGGNLTSGFDVGYRNAFGSTAPSLVVQGSVSLTSQWGNAGSIYNGPNYNTDTNASIGPSTAPWVPAKLNMGGLVYGGSLNAVDWQYGTATKNANFLDFAAAKTQLSGLSSQLAGSAQNGSWALGAGGVTLTGDGSSDVQIFNLGNTALSNITLNNVKAGAHVVINSTLTNVVFSGNLGGDQANSSDGLASHRDRLIFNLSNATNVNVSSFLNGSVLAVNADVIGSGHLEGTLIANSLSAGPNGKLELGYEPFIPTSPVPEPESYALMLAGLAAMGFIARRRRQT